MPEAVLTTTTNASNIPTIIANKVLQRLPSLFVLAKNVSKDSDWTTATKGLTININKLGTVTTNDKEAGVAFTKQAPSLTYTSVTLDKHKEATIAIDDVTKVVEQEETQNKYADDMAIAIAERVESDGFALHPSIQRAITWSRSSATAVDNSLLAIRKDFVDQKVPAIEPRYFACDATIMNDLLAQQKYTDRSWRGENNAINEGVVIRVYGLQIEESQLIPLTGSPGAYHNIVFTRTGLVLASRPLPRPEGFGGNYSIVNDPNIGIAVRTLFWYNGDLGCHQLTLELLYGWAISDQRRVLEVESF